MRLVRQGKSFFERKSFPQVNCSQIQALAIALQQATKKPAQLNTERASFNNPGDFLLSHAVTRAVPSAPTGLTSVFGMGTGVTLPTKSPEKFSEI